MFKIRRIFALALLTSAFTVGCGGSSSDPIPPTNPVDTPSGSLPSADGKESSEDDMIKPMESAS